MLFAPMPENTASAEPGKRVGSSGAFRDHMARLEKGETERGVLRSPRFNRFILAWCGA